MKKVDDLQIGDKFQLGDRKFVIEEEKTSEYNFCKGCFFAKFNLECQELQTHCILPQCSAGARKDKKDVVFKEIENEI